MLKIFNRRTALFCRKLGLSYSKRCFLSNPYKCSDAWENRLRSPIFEKVDLNNLYHELDLNFKNKNRINVLDIDLFANLLKDVSYKSELEDILLKLRSTPECVLLPERTSYAIIKWYIDNNLKEDLLYILSDRLNYGIFPDHHLANLLMDNFLTNNDPVSAVKIAALQMLQEDFDHPILKALALYSCYNYLASSDVWESVKKTEDNDEEVVKVRVDYVRNPYFDDHFDIEKPNHMIGKTLLMLGEKTEGALGASSKLMGLVLYEKFENCAKFLEHSIKNNHQVLVEAVTKAKNLLMENPEQVKDENAKATKLEVDENVNNWKNKILELFTKLDKKNLVEGNLLSDAEELLKKTIEEHEKKDIDLQYQVFQQWESERENHIRSELELSELEQVKADIAKVKKELKTEEEKLFYFDNEDEILLAADEKQKELESVVFYKEKKKKYKSMESEYIPPEVQKKKS